MELWRTIWRTGFLPQFSDEQLLRLKTALETDDLRLVQRKTTDPPPLQCMQDIPVEAVCLIGFCGWTEERRLVGNVETYVSQTCFEADQLTGELMGSKYFLNFWDDTPRGEAFQIMLEEIEFNLAERAID